MQKRHPGGSTPPRKRDARREGSPPRRRSRTAQRRARRLSHPHQSRRRLPRLSPQVRSVAVTHTFRIAKARAQLGYAPGKFSFADAVERYVQSTAGRPRGPAAPTRLRLLLALLLLAGLLALALHLSGLQPSGI